MTATVTRGRTDIPWPNESLALFNPALISLLLRELSNGYSRERGQGLPVAYAFVFVPAALHHNVRAALPRTVKTPMSVWTTDQPGALYSFSGGARGLVPHVARGIVFGQRHGVILGARGALLPGEITRKRKGHPESDEVKECLKAAHFLGRWAAQESDVASVFAFWGVRP
jgi:hypothetical protein